MAKYAWMTDIHLDHLSDKNLKKFLENHQLDVDGYLITGDISVSTMLVKHLTEMKNAWVKPIYFVLGNHDFWYSSVSSVRRRVKDIGLYYMTELGVEPLNSDCAVVGDDGWYDGLCGNPFTSKFMMADWFHMQEYVKITQGVRNLGFVYRPDIVQLSQELASQSAIRLKKRLTKAISSGFKNIIVLTHVPPWSEAHVYNGRKVTSDEDSAPWFSSKIMGDMLESVADKNVDVEFTVLCGHTHGACQVQVRDNMICKVGGSEYGSPGVAGIIEI